MSLSGWSDPFREEDSMSVALRLCGHFAERLADGPFLNAVRRQDWEAVCKAVPDYTAEPEQVYAQAQITALFKKAPFLPLKVDAERAALEKFVETEINCVRTNSLFDMREAGRFSFDPAVERVLFASSRKISQVLGEVPSFDRLNFRFTSGASTQVKKKDSSIRSQLMADLACSESMYLSGLATRVIGAAPAWFHARSGDSKPAPRAADVKMVTVRASCAVSYEHHRPSPLDAGFDYGGNTGFVVPYCPLISVPMDLIVESAVLELVLKTVFEHRAIIKEPPLNKYAQTAYGDCIRDKLLTVGVDIRQGQRKQSIMARRGSLTGALATLDLTSASDNIAYRLVMDQYPLEWFTALSDVRSDRVSVMGRTLEMEKFSGMGNGYTFPVQSLLFWAIVRACADQFECEDDTVSVYGDDIICPVECVPLVLKVFHAVGLVVNLNKSFWSGSFRESCGTDWLFGKNVRPVYLKKDISPEYLRVLHNEFFRKGEFEAAEILLSYIPPDSELLFGPDGYGDGHLIRKDWAGERYLQESKVQIFDPVKQRTCSVRALDGTPVRAPTGYDLCFFRTVRNQPRFDWEQSHYDLAAILYQKTGSGSGRGGTNEHSSRFSESYKRELEQYLEDGMSVASLGHAIRMAKNKALYATLPDEVVPSRQRKSRNTMWLPETSQGSWGPLTSTVGGSSIGMPLPGSEEAEVVTICILGR